MWNESRLSKSSEIHPCPRVLLLKQCWGWGCFFGFFLFSTGSMFCWKQPCNSVFSRVSVVLGTDCCLNWENGFNRRRWVCFALLPSIYVAALLSLAANCRAEGLSSSWEQLNLLTKHLALGWGQRAAPCLAGVKGLAALTRLRGHLIIIYFNRRTRAGGTLGASSPTCCPGQPWGRTRFLRAFSSLVLNTSKDGDGTTSLGSLHQHWVAP